MASRNLCDTVPQLEVAFLASKKEWDTLHPEGPEPIVICTYRSNEEQEALYNQGRKWPGKKVTNAKPGQSKHNQLPSHAIDIAFVRAGKTDYREILFEEFAILMKKYSVNWGGDFKGKFKDKPHFEI
jgi:peptidoglycan L-alanyl-D-glutamate endopeptidase CwlK